MSSEKYIGPCGGKLELCSDGYWWCDKCEDAHLLSSDDAKLFWKAYAFGRDFALGELRNKVRSLTNKTEVTDDE